MITASLIPALRLPQPSRLSLATVWASNITLWRFMGTPKKAGLPRPLGLVIVLFCWDMMLKSFAPRAALNVKKTSAAPHLIHRNVSGKFPGHFFKSLSSVFGMIGIKVPVYLVYVAAVCTSTVTACHIFTSNLFSSFLNCFHRVVPFFINIIHTITGINHYRIIEKVTA